MDKTELRYFKKRLRKIRTDLGLTQKEFAAMLNISRSYVARYESLDNDFLPSAKINTLICEKFHVYPKYLRDGVPPMFEENIAKILISELKAFADLSELDIKFLYTYVNLPKEQRDDFMNFLKSFIK